MGKKRASPELSQAELLPTQEEQVLANPNPPTRKKPITSDSDDDKPQPKRARLTRENLALFNKMGKEKVSQDSTTESQETKDTSTVASDFAIQALRNGILDPIRSKPPANLKDIQKRHSRSRITAPPTQSEYQIYTRKVFSVPNEATMVFETGKRLLEDYDDNGYSRAFNQPFTGFPNNVGFNTGLSTPQPDFIEGLEMEEYEPFPIHTEINGAVLYKNKLRSLILPHIAGEWKGPSGTLETARLQSAYDGAALVFGRNQALSYIGKPDPPGHAEITTFVTNGTDLEQYAHYAEELEDGTIKYHQYRLKSKNIINSYKDYKKGYKHLRNAQDHAKNQSYALRDNLKEYWKQQRNT